MFSGVTLPACIGTYHTEECSTDGSQERVSIWPGFESLRADVERLLVKDVLGRLGRHREAILNRKTETLLNECADYLGVALEAAKASESDRQRIKNHIISKRSAVDDLKLALHLTVKHTAANTRTINEKILSRHEPELIDSLLQDFEIRFPRWARSLKYAAEMFNEWLQSAMIEKMAALSSQHREDFIEPIQRVGRQLSQLLQDFRYGISEATLATLGVPLRTTEVELAFKSPRTPDIRVGNIFDRNWELISLLLPMFAVKGILETHFRRKIRDIVFKDLSRLAFQWEGLVNASFVSDGE